MNLLLQCPIKEVLGYGGIKKRPFLQMLHTAYNLWQQYQLAIWRKMWKKATQCEWADIKCPVLSRWDHVGECAENLKAHKENWLKACQHIIDINKTGSNKHDISSSLFSYLNEEIIWAQLLFICGYIESFYDSLFQWNKQIDPLTKRAGFWARDMAVHV